MIIPITISTDSSSAKLPSGLARISHDEIVLVELQGALDVGDCHPTERNGKLVGKLSIDDAMKKPTLLIGHHLLEGKVAAIPKPLAIMHRTNAAAKNIGDDMEVDDEPQLDGSIGGTRGGNDGQSAPEWTILGLVKKKIIFSKRPMPVIKRS
ncbi:hypothetical protein D9611_001831 [Ephemerocybe angulata]|uniref:Chromosome transmission fidelity protein 8 n=1 Tax=Ephemerocybe angulata TaxID=980116 RepID=A0A8H5FLY3_9AGAR|nr:hypothetical protein D9611_001831 [Tulosesus angulatus]